jgi:large repetitive protein
MPWELIVAMLLVLANGFFVARMSAIAHFVSPGGNEGFYPLELGAPAVDQTPPVLLGIPDDIPVEASNSQGAVVEYMPAAIDGVDGEVPVTCSPTSGSTFPLGASEVSCGATDSSGNHASATFEVLVQDLLPPDTTPPDTEILTGPAASEMTGAAVSITYAGDPAADVDGYECRLDAAVFASCPAAGRDYSGLTSGGHTFAVRAVDASDNADETPATRSFTVDADPPETTIVAGPSGTISQSTATFTFSSEAGAIFQCRMDGEQFGPCGSPKAYGGLSDSQHEFVVRAIDEVGNVDPTPAFRSFIVDIAPPSQPVQTPSQGEQPSSPAPAVMPGGHEPTKPTQPRRKPLRCKRGFKKKK